MMVLGEKKTRYLTKLFFVKRGEQWEPRFTKKGFVKYLVFFCPRTIIIYVCNAVRTAAIRRASVHNTVITMRYARIDSVLCLNGQYMAQNLSPDMKVAEISEACKKMV